MQKAIVHVWRMLDEEDKYNITYCWEEAAEMTPNKFPQIGACLDHLGACALELVSAGYKVEYSFDVPPDQAGQQLVPSHRAYAETVLGVRKIIAIV